MCCLGGSILSCSRMKRSFVATVSWNWNTEGFVTWTWKIQLSNEKSPGCLGYTGDYTTQLYRDYNKPLDIRIQDPNYCWVVSIIMLYVHPKPWGRWTHFDEHIFQMGWNRQFSCDWWLVLFRCFLGTNTNILLIQWISRWFRIRSETFATISRCGRWTQMCTFFFNWVQAETWTCCTFRAAKGEGFNGERQCLICIYLTGKKTLPFWRR